MNYQIVTGIFEIGRETLDGRDIEFYEKKLIKLLETYPNAIVFHNCLNSKFIESQISATFVFMEIFDLPLFEMKHLISESIESNAYNFRNKDLVFQSLLYGILVNSKLYFLRRAFEINPKDYVVWLDAGISRFYDGDNVPLIDLKKFPKLLRFSAVFEIDLINWARNINIFSLPRNWIRIGSSKRVISGGGFFVNGKAIQSLESEYQAFIIENLRLQMWDTEQVNLLKFAHKKNFYYQIKDSKSVTNLLSKSKSGFLLNHFYLLANKIINLII